MTPSPDTLAAAPIGKIAKLAKKSASTTLADRLVKRGHSAELAETISRAIVDPTDARARLDRLTPLRVPGGTMYALDCVLWVPALIPYPSNSREASQRYFPIGTGDSDAAAYPPIRQPTTDEDDLGAAALEFDVESPEHLIWALDRAMAFLQGNNPLNESIAEQGIMVPIVAAVAHVVPEDSSSDLTMLTTPDGSSRIASALTILGLEPEEVVFSLRESDRRYRQLITDTLAVLERPRVEVSEDDLARVRALQVPARLLLDFTPDAENIDFAIAVDSLVHLVHVEPPKEWDEAGAYDAKAEAVLDEMVDFGLIDTKYREYLAGMLTPEESEEGGFSRYEDVRAATVLTVFRAGKFHDAVKEGIRILSPRKYARREEKVKIAVELSLRAQRARLTTAEEKIARNTLRSAYLEEEIWSKDWESSDDGPGTLKNAALRELRETGPGPKARELAVLGVYWLGVHGMLRDAHFFAERDRRDGRTPQRVVDALIRRPWGIQILHRAIVDGRAGRKPRSVDETGRLRKNSSGDTIPMSNSWLRGEVAPDGVPIESADIEQTATARLRSQIAVFSSQVDTLESAHDEVEEVKGGNGQSLVDEEGWESGQALSLQARLMALANKLVIHGHVWDSKHASAAEESEE